MHNQILNYLLQYPNSTAKQIAEHLGVSTASVSTTLCYMRATGFVTDGSNVTVHANGIAWNRPRGVVHWTAI